MENYWNKLTSEEFWEQAVDATIDIMLILIISWIAVRLGKKIY